MDQNRQGGARYKGVTSYLEPIITNRAATLSRAYATLVDKDFDTLVGRGLSGALIIPELASILGKRWAVVRKPGDSNHREYAVEGTIGKRWIFVDDVISTGATYRDVHRQVDNAYVAYLERREEFNDQPAVLDAGVIEHVGYYLYYHNVWSSDNNGW